MAGSFSHLFHDTRRAGAGQSVHLWTADEIETVRRMVLAKKRRREIAEHFSVTPKAIQHVVLGKLRMGRYALPRRG